MMKMSFVARIALLTAVLAFIVLSSTIAQEETPTTAYYLTADSNDIQQIYVHVLDGQSEARQISFAEQDVATFGVAYDGLSIAYISDGQLWLQPIHTEEAEALTTISAERILGSPVFSQDGQYIAYCDNGIWLLDLSTGETRQILEDVALDHSDVTQYRVQVPDTFILDDDGKAIQLTTDVAIWEWRTPGVYDMASGEYKELGRWHYTRSLLLSDGRMLLYGNREYGSLSIGESIEAYSNLMTFEDITDASLSAEQAVEIEPGIVRVFGTATGENLPLGKVHGFTFDVDIAIAEATDVLFFTLATEEEGLNHWRGMLSPDGRFLPVYLKHWWRDSGGVYGTLKLIDLTTGETADLHLPEVVGILRWQP